jgi:uncharacterized membrane protein YoaK (UPF0700 family)
MLENHRSDSWLSFGLAFVGGYCDAAGYILAKTFTGHITGTLVLAAIGVAGHDWRTFLRHLLAIVLFLTGVVLMQISERFIARTWSRFPLTVVMGVEIVLILTAYLALASHLTAKLQLVVSCMCGVNADASRLAEGPVLKAQREGYISRERSPPCSKPKPKDTVPKPPQATSQRPIKRSNFSVECGWPSS